MQPERENAGFSTIETAVALVLVAVVAIPSVAMLMQLAETAYGAREVEALAIGRDVMETWISTNDFSSGTLLLQNGKWRVRRAATLNGNQVVLSVEVYRRHRPQPEVSLVTARLQPVDSLRYAAAPGGTAP